MTEVDTEVEQVVTRGYTMTNDTNGDIVPEDSNLTGAFRLPQEGRGTMARRKWRDISGQLTPNR